MTAPAPLPFRFKVGEETTWDVTTMREVSSRLDGLLHLEEDVVILEWTRTDTIEEVGFTGGTDEKRVSELEGWEIPIEWILDARLVGGWFFPAVELRARAMHVFEGIPGANASTVRLRYARRDGGLARDMVAGINKAVKGEG
jgi:hypothetical protein